MRLSAIESIWQQMDEENFVATHRLQLAPHQTDATCVEQMYDVRIYPWKALFTHTQYLFEIWICVLISWGKPGRILLALRFSQTGSTFPLLHTFTVRRVWIVFAWCFHVHSFAVERAIVVTVNTVNCCIKNAESLRKCSEYYWNIKSSIGGEINPSKLTPPFSWIPL